MNKTLPARWPPRAGSERFPDMGDEMQLRELGRDVTLLAESIDKIVQAIASPSATATPTPGKRLTYLIHNIGVTKRRLQILRRSTQKAPYVEPAWGKLMGRPVTVTE